MESLRTVPGVKIQNGMVALELCSKLEPCPQHTQLFSPAETYQLQERLDKALAQLAGLELINIPVEHLLEGDILWDLGRKTVDGADYIEEWDRESTQIITLVRVQIGDGASSLDLTPDTRLWVARLGESATSTQPAPSLGEEGTAG